MASSPKPSLNGLPELLLDALVSNILNVCPTLTSSFLHEMGSQVHASTIRALFSTLNIPDDVRYFLHGGEGSLLSDHPLSAVLRNPTRYAHIVKRIVVDEPELPSTSRSHTGALGLITVYGDNDEEMVTNRSGRIAVQPMRAQDLTSLLTLCGDLESFVWRSSNPPPDGVVEDLSEHCPKLSSFSFRPDPPLRAASVDKVSGISHPSSRANVVKWDAPSFRLPPILPLTQLHIARLSQSGSQALASFFKQLGDESLLEDVNLDLVWFDDVCESLVKAGRRIKKLQLGTSGTKLTDKDIVMIFEGCEALEDFALVEAEEARLARLSRKLWSKVEIIPARLRKFAIKISESGPHHSWIADHLESFASLKLNTVTHLSITRLLPIPQLTASGTELKYDSKIDSVAALKPIPSDVVDAIREMPFLVNLQCDWWSWKLDDVKELAEKCNKLEHLELALDAPFAKLLSATSVFTPLTQLRHLAVCIPLSHSPGLIPPLSSPLKPLIHPLTPAASPVRRRTSLPSPVSDFASQVFVGEDFKANEHVDISFPSVREIKKFVKKCPRLLELEWYGRNARGRWLISRNSNSSSKLSPNVTVEYVPPVASIATWARVTLEKAALDFVTLGNGSLSHDIPRHGQAWTGPKAEEFKYNLEKEKGKERDALSNTMARDKPTKYPNKRERVSTSTLSSASDDSGTLAHPQSKDNGIPSPTSPVLPLSQGLYKANTMVDSPVEDQGLPHQPQFISRSIPNESPIRTNDNESHRSRRATLSEINTPPTTPSKSTPTTAFPGAFRRPIHKERSELKNKNDNGKGNGNTSANQSQQEAYNMHAPARGRGNSYSRGTLRRGVFGRGGDSHRGFTNNSINVGRGFATTGNSRRGGTVPM